LWSGISDGDIILFNPVSVGTTRYRYRGTRIPSPWSGADETVVA
jgi:RNA-directed DNA polymerase